MSFNCISVDDVVKGEDAAVILHYKDRLKPGRFVNICGQVTAVSEVIRVKNDHLFLVELENVVIIVKQEKFLYWQEKITPQKMFVFCKLRPTTLLKDWLTKNTPPGHAIDYNIALNSPATEDQTILVSYQGVITSTTNSRYGIYELDKKIRLCVSAVPARNRFVLMKVGSRVVVYNVHRKEFTPEARIHLYCCMKSCIRVLEECPRSPSRQTKVHKFCPNSPVVQLIARYGLNGSEVSGLLNMMDRMKAVTKGLAKVEDVVSCILSSFCSWLQPHLRNLVSEFLAVPHCCHFTVHKTSSERVPVIDAIARLLDAAHSTAQDVTAVKKHYSHSNLPPSEHNKQLYWSYLPQVIEKNPQQILIGWLEFSSVTGHLELSDGTDKISVVCAASLDHTCDKSCLALHIGKPLTCPRLHPGLNRCLVGVGQCEVITERFPISDVPAGEHSDHVLQSQCVVYLLVSLTNCLLLATQESCENFEPPAKLLKLSSDDGVHVTNNGMKVTNDGIKVTNDDVTSDSVNVINDGVKRIDNDTDGDVKVTDDVTSDSTDITDTGGDRQEDAGWKTGSFQLVFITHLDSRTLKSSNTGRSSRFSALAYFIDDPKDISLKQREDFHPMEAQQQGAGYYNTYVPPDHTNEEIVIGRNYTITPTVLVFKGRSVRWYECLQMGSFYRLVSKGDKSVFKYRQCYGSRLRAAVESSRARVCFEVLDDVHLIKVLSESVKGLSEETMANLEPAPLDTVVEILSESFSGTVVSFSAEILSRKHLDRNPTSSYKLASCRTEELKKTDRTSVTAMVKRKTVCLEVGDSARCCVLVYMNLENTVYPLGLLPGSRVLFTRLERRVSHSGTIYCQYTAVSSVLLCHLPAKHSHSLCGAMIVRDQGEVTQVNTRLQGHYLAELYHGLESPVGSFQVICHICTFIKLSLRVVCVGCGTLFRHSGCTNAQCSTTKSTCLAKASVLVDDGSSVAVVSFNKADLVCRVLCLSQDQWQDLQDMVQCHEEVFIHQFIGYFKADSPVEKFLMFLCDSSHVKRRIHMCVRPVQASPYTKPATLNIDNFTKEEYMYKSITTGDRSFETRCHPYVQLECLDIEELCLEQELVQKLSSSSPH